MKYTSYLTLIIIVDASDLTGDEPTFYVSIIF